MERERTKAFSGRLGLARGQFSGPWLFSTAEARTSNSPSLVFPFGFLGAGGRLQKERRGRVCCATHHHHDRKKVQFTIVTFYPQNRRLLPSVLHWLGRLLVISSAARAAHRRPLLPPEARRADRPVRRKNVRVDIGRDGARAGAAESVESARRRRLVVPEEPEREHVAARAEHDRVGSARRDVAHLTTVGTAAHPAELLATRRL